MAIMPNAPAVAHKDAPLLVEFLLDQTGSMFNYTDSVIAGYNAFVSDQRNAPGKCLLTLTKFNNYNVITPFQDLNVSMVPSMTHGTYDPDGSTNLYDAISVRWASLSARISGWSRAPNVLFVVMTDGLDNISVTTREEIRQILGDAGPGVTFVFMGAFEGARTEALNMGFCPKNIRVFEKTEIKGAMTTLSAATTAYRSAPNQSFFAEDTK